MAMSQSAAAQRAGRIAAVVTLFGGVLAAATFEPAGNEEVGTSAVEAADADPAPLTLPPVLTTLLPLLPPVPDLTLPPVTVPGVDLPPVTVPDIDLPPITLPLVEREGVFYVHESGTGNEVLQLSWSGRRLQRIAIDTPVDCCGAQSSAPDGRYFRLGFDLYDQTGQRLGQLSGNVWGLDGEHTCDTRPHVPSEGLGQSDLVVFDRANTGRVVALLPTPTPGEAAVVVACDPARDRAVVVVDNPPNRRTLVVRLSDGRITAGPAACSQGWAVSPDGRFVVEGVEPRQPGRICDIDSGAVVAELPIPGELLGDGSTIVTTEADECGWFRRLVVSNWHTGERFWTSDQIDDQLPCDQALVPSRTHPTTASFALQVVTVNETSSPPSPGPVYVSDGRHPPVLVVESADYAAVF